MIYNGCGTQFYTNFAQIQIDKLQNCAQRCVNGQCRPWKLINQSCSQKDSDYPPSKSLKSFIYI